MFRRVTVLAWLGGIATLVAAGAAFAQTQICAADLDGDGDADSQVEQGVCATYPTGNLCPIQSAACTSASGSPPVIAVAIATGIVANDDGRSGGQFLVESPAVNEGPDGTTSVGVRVTFPLSSVDREIVVEGLALTATEGADFNVVVGGGLLIANETTMVIPVEIVGDVTAEGLESFQLVVYEAADPLTTRSWGEIRIIDDDVTAASSGIAIGPAWIEEGNSGTTLLSFPVTLSAPAADSVTVDFQTADATALAGSDYLAASGTLRFEPGVLAQTLQVAVIGEFSLESDESFTVTLSNARASSPPTCPLNPARPCIADGAGVSSCSLQDCFLRSDVGGIVVEPPSVPPNNDGPRDAAGNCLGALRIFPGMYSRCRTVGTQTQFSNCCRNRGEAANDSMGAAGVLTQQANVMRTISTASSAMMTGGLTAANEILATSFDPATFSVALALTAMAEMLGEACDERDMQTALLKDSGYCVLLGEYCAEEWPLVGCVQRAQGYCCYNSMLARIINEAGRAQIPSVGGFGTPREPNCRGFTPDEFQAIDFSKVDLSEYFAEIRTKNQSLIEGEIRPRINQQIRGGP